LTVASRRPKLRSNAVIARLAAGAWGDYAPP
jgi:hypothetical protein